LKSKMTRSQVVLADPDTILSSDEVALWLNVERREVARLGVPCLQFDKHPKSIRYFKRDVTEWLQQHRKAS
jgi:hypothetical protein